MATPVHNVEPQQLTVAFVLQLHDGFTGEPHLEGDVTVEVANREVARAKPDRAQFLFFTLPSGPYSLTVQSEYYVPVSIPVTLPMTTALWPAFPDRALADPALQLDDPGQTAAYLAQRAMATLQPSVQYPFRLGANLARGTVESEAHLCPAQQCRGLAIHKAMLPASTVSTSCFFPQ